MASCEKCWRDAGGNPDRYAELVKQRRCTPEEQAGPDAGACYVCGRKTMHQHCHVCMNPSCSSNTRIADTESGLSQVPAPCDCSVRGWDADGRPIIDCAKGGHCKWRTDGLHANIFCGKCFTPLYKVRLKIDAPNDPLDRTEEANEQV